MFDPGRSRTRKTDLRLTILSKQQLINGHWDLTVHSRVLAPAHETWHGSGGFGLSSSAKAVAVSGILKMPVVCLLPVSL